jgi:hypothetical protein
LAILIMVLVLVLVAQVAGHAGHGAQVGDWDGGVGAAAAGCFVAGAGHGEGEEVGEVVGSSESGRSSCVVEMGGVVDCATLLRTRSWSRSTVCASANVGRREVGAV